MVANAARAMGWSCDGGGGAGGERDEAEWASEFCGRVYIYLACVYIIMCVRIGWEGVIGAACQYMNKERARAGGGVYGMI